MIEEPRFRVGAKIQTVRDEMLSYDEVPGVTRTLWKKGAIGYVAGILTYHRRGPLRVLVTFADASDWEEFSIPEFRKAFRVIH